ncbi:hypothetical protein WKW77_25075 [Variovorax ureilyticus]|uniref:Uncharacterized protein n=1 Tax=Variovorax ureilyticus TaxID=1836198 RepID=A0ABU8VLJ4_9BURK
MIVGLKAPPQRVFDDSPTDANGANYTRFELQPGSAVAPGSWGLAVADALIAGGGGWHNPAPDRPHA